MTTATLTPTPTTPTPQPAPIARLLDSDTLAALLATRADIRLIDVRSPGEYESAHIDGSYNVPLDALDHYAADLREALAGRPVVLICQTSRRAREAAAKFHAFGVADVHVLEAGLTAWQAFGHPVVQGPQRISLERQVRVAAGLIGATGALLSLTVNRWFGAVPLFIGSGMLFAGVTDTCGLALLLARLPYNRPAHVDLHAMVDALKTGAPPTGVGRDVPASASTVTDGIACCR